MITFSNRWLFTGTSMFNLHYSHYGILVFILFNTIIAQAQPDMAQKLVFDDVIVYRDAKKSNLFYLLPGDLQIATDEEGMPDFKLLLMRYTGTRTYDDQGSFRFRNLLQMRIIHSSPFKDVLAGVKQKLKSIAAEPQLLTFPIKNLRSVVVCAAINQGESSGNSYTNKDGHFNQDKDENLKNEYWKERNYVIRLDNTSANILWDAIEKHQTILSVGFAFYAQVFNSQKADLLTSGNVNIAEELQELIDSEADDKKDDTVLDTRVIKAGAFEIIIDTKKWPDLIKKVDINEQIPPDYAAINIYCYDFNNDMRKDLAQKKIEIEATGVGGGKVIMKYTFRQDSPDIYAYDLKFPYAVRIDTPYKYRITEISIQGNVTRSEWITRESWHEILDITTRSND